VHIQKDLRREGRERMEVLTPIQREYYNNVSLQNTDTLKAFVGSLYETQSRHLVQPTNLIEDYWSRLAISLGDFKLLLAFYFFMNTCYIVGGFSFWVIDKLHLLHKYKIQQKYPTSVDYVTCIMNLVQNYVLIIFPLVFIAFPLFNFLGFTSALPLPSAFTFLFHLAFYIFVEDVTHYWLHRALHIPYLYKWIHKVHHQFASPFGLSAAFSHPLEVLILAVPTFLGPLLIRPHYLTFYTWVLFRQLDAVSTHSGYDLPNILNLVPFYGGTSSHDFHHKSFIFNYSSRFTFMDVIFGTYKDV